MPDSTLPQQRELFYSAAVGEALRDEMRRDPNVVLIGEDIGVYGGAFGVTRGLFDEFGPDRIWETPISENSFVGMAVGAAMMGLRPVVEIMFMDFITLAIDQLANSAAKLHYMYDEQVCVPMVLRTPGGAKGGYGPSHSQMLANLLVGIPGLKVVAPSTAAMAKGLLLAAIRDDNPVVVIENKRLYGKRGAVPEGDTPVELGQAWLAATGGDATIITYSSMVPVCLDLKQAFLTQGLDLEVLDLVSLQPLDTDAIRATVEKTGKVVIVEEACKTGSVGAEVSAWIAENCLDVLEAPVKRVGAEDLPIPASMDLEKLVLPSIKKIAEAVHQVLNW